MNPKKLTTNSGLPGELLSQLRILGGDTDRAGVEVAVPHHDAAHTTSGAVAKPYSSAPSRRGDDDVSAGLELAIGLDDDTVTQTVEHQRLLRLGQPELPRQRRHI